jgi:hypothetical protein
MRRAWQAHGDQIPSNRSYSDVVASGPDRANLRPRDVRPYIVRKVTKFSYAIDKRYLPVLLPFLLRPSRDGVIVTDEGSLVATFGPFRISTSLSNITGAHVTRNYRWWTAFGVRMSRADDGLTFGTNHNAGVCIHFGEKVPSALRRSGHSALTVTVTDLNGLTSALSGDVEEPTANPT